jgi:outer membrane murein-binding lipoprotein Lpp
MYRTIIQARAARPLAVTAVAALLAITVISGCGSTGSPPASQTAAPPPAAPSSSAPAAPPSSDPTSTTSSCTAWPGVGALAAVAFPMRELADDEEINGPDSGLNNSAEMAVSIAESGLARIVTQLPNPYYSEIQNEVLSVGPSSSAAQLDTAASDAESLAATIAQLCYTA